MNYDRLIESSGFPITPETRARFETAMGSLSDRLSPAHKLVHDAASIGKITPQRYLLAELLTDGVKKDMAVMLGVSTQARWQYEIEHEATLHVLRPEIATLVRLELIAIIRDAKHQPTD